MEEKTLPAASLESYRARYLKLKSVLYDRTTGLPAFPVLLDRLRALLDERRALGVLHVGLGNLDLVESLYGWQVFDRIVEHAAAELRDAVGEELPRDTLLGLSAVAGDGFTVFIPEQPDGSDADASYLQGVGRKLRRRLEGAFGGEAFAGLNPRLQVRCGHALLSQNPFYRFERRLHSAVARARSYDERKRSRRELSWGDELQRLIEDAAVSTVFQPVVDLRSGVVLGYEALARGPKDSPFEMPRAMFSLSSRVGVSADLDRICHEAALRACAGMAENCKIFLNVLPVSLQRGAWAEDGFLSLLKCGSRSPQDLIIEISERRSDSDLEPFVELLKRLKRHGFGVALDNIGTGYGSQAILESVRPDYLKLDISLVRNIHENLIKQEVLRSLIRIAERIGASVIAEGVETQEEATVLADAGAQYGQGFLFAVPAPAVADDPRGREPKDH